MLAPVADVPRTLVLTGHFPPEPGGVQTFVWELLRRLPAERLTVVAPHYRGDRDFDGTLPFPVYRRHGYLLVRRLREIVREHGCETAWVPAFAPFGLFVPWLRHAGVRRVVASTHGQELGWMNAPPTREALRRMARGVDVLTYLSPYTAGRLKTVVERPEILERLVGGVDTEVFHPRAATSDIRARLGVAEGPLVVSVSRLVRRKGHDVLVRGWPQVLARFPDAHLVIIGTGPMRRRLQSTAEELGVGRSVTVTGFLPLDETAAAVAAADVFVLACRDDRRGLQTEGLGLVALEASASGVPVVVGRSGGSEYALLEGVTGTLVEHPEDPDAIATAVLDLLADPLRAGAMGAAGREWVCRTSTWDDAARRLAGLLSAG